MDDFSTSGPLQDANLSSWPAPAVDDDPTCRLHTQRLHPARDSAAGSTASRAGASPTHTNDEPTAELRPDCAQDGASSAQYDDRFHVDPLVGRRIGPYRIQAIIAQGGMGLVYRGIREDDYQCEVAIKVLRTAVISPDARRRFHNERQTLATLNHPNIAQLLDGGTLPDGTPFLVMPFIPGRRITEYCTAEQLSLRDKARLMLTVCHAVDHAHRQGVLHRDLKPSNVLVTDDSFPVITDFGLAKQLTQADADDDPTCSGWVLGTPRYMAPEQTDSEVAGPVSFRTDVYGLGTVLYELLSGHPPFRGTDVLATLQQVQTQRPKPLQQVPRDLDTVVGKCLEKDPDQRYHDAREVADELQRFLAGTPVLARPVGRLEQTWRWCTRNSLVASLLITLFVVLMTSLVAVTTLWQLARVRGEEADRRAREEMAAKRLSESHLRAALSAVDKFTELVEGRLSTDPNYREMRRELLLEALALYEGLREGSPDEINLKHEQAVAWYLLGNVEMSLGDRQSAWKYFYRALESFDQLHREFPRHRRFRFDRFHTRLALSFAHKGNAPRSLEQLVEAHTIINELVGDYPDEPDYHDALAHTLYHLGRKSLLRNQLDHAQAYLRLGARTASQSIERWPHATKARRNISTNMMILSRVLWIKRQDAAAVAAIETAVDHARQLACDHPGHHVYCIELMRAQRENATLLAMLGRYPEAYAKIEEHLDVVTAWSDDPTLPQLNETSSAFRLATHLALLAGHAELAEEHVRFQRDTELQIAEMQKRSSGTLQLGESYLFCPIPRLRDSTSAASLLRNTNYRGFIRSAQGLHQQAIDDLQQVCDSGYPACQQARAELYLAKDLQAIGDTSLASDYFERVNRQLASRELFSAELLTLRDEVARALRQTTDNNPLITE